ncbi:MAG: DTW domain-containing protein [Deltaproteobacteria bacterium]|nr:DTW domain-containing protein [Deltaproteobacteria bacterium]
MGFREFCLECRRARRVCQCADIRKLATDQVFAILTHPVERRMKTGTGRLAHLCISNSVLIEGAGFKDDPRVNALIEDPRYFPTVLYPGRASIEIQELAVPQDRRLLMFVVDTKWSLAKSVLNRSPNLKALPQIRFTPTRPSGFHIRRQPRANCLSTIEAIHFVLERLAPGTAEHSHLIEAFDKMVRRQMDFESKPTRRHFL